MAGASPLRDTGTLSGVGPEAAGTITFELFGPGDSGCATPVFVSRPVAVAGPGVYPETDSGFVTSTPGAYQWVESYSGDAGDAPVRGRCGDTGESSTVVGVTTQADATQVLGGPISDTALVVGPVPSGGSVTFSLFGPHDTSCSRAVFTSQPVPVSGPGTYTEKDFYVPGAAGTYQWIETLTDSTSGVVARGRCGDTAETTVVTAPVTQAVPPQVPTQIISDLGRPASLLQPWPWPMAAGALLAVGGLGVALVVLLKRRSDR
jgi:hypothetical protein